MPLKLPALDAARHAACPAGHKHTDMPDASGTSLSQWTLYCMSIVPMEWQRLYLHALFTSSLLLQQLLFAADVTSIAFGKHILAHCCMVNQARLSIQDAWYKCLSSDRGWQHAHKKPVKLRMWTSALKGKPSHLVCSYNLVQCMLFLLSWQQQCNFQTTIAG